MVFSDHVALPFKLGFTSVYKAFAERGMHENVAFIGSGKLGFPQQAMLSLALGCDMVNVAREAMLAIGCIQSQQCHTGHCPTGVATQSPWLMKGLNPTLKAARLANYLLALRKEMISVANACGAAHPALVSVDRYEILDGMRSASAREVFGYEPGWGMPSEDDQRDLRALMSLARHQANRCRIAAPPGNVWIYAWGTGVVSGASLRRVHPRTRASAARRRDRWRSAHGPREHQRR